MTAWLTHTRPALWGGWWKKGHAKSVFKSCCWAREGLHAWPIYTLPGLVFISSLGNPTMALQSPHLQSVWLWGQNSPLSASVFPICKMGPVTKSFTPGGGSIFFFLATPQGMWDLISLTGDENHIPSSGYCSLNHWTTPKVPGRSFLRIRMFTYVKPPEWINGKCSTNVNSILILNRE